jgi:hypothetical protein
MHKHTARPTDRPSITGLLCAQGREEFLIIARRPADLVQYHNVTMPPITATDLGDRCLTEQWDDLPYGPGRTAKKCSIPEVSAP